MQMKIYAFFALFFFTTLLHCQTQTMTPLWMKGIAGSNNEQITGMDIDKDGNVIVCGQFDSNVLSFGNITLNKTSGSTSEYFLIKCNPQGSVLWAWNGEGSARDVTFDSNGNVILVGYFNTAAIAFDSFTLTNAQIGQYDIFVAKFNSNGNIVWAKRAGGTGTELSERVCMDGNNAILIAGGIYASAFGFGSSSISHTGSNYNILVLKFDASGNAVWADEDGGTLNDFAYGICVDSNNNLLVTGNYANSNGYLIYLSKYNSGGTLAWSQKINSGTGNSIVCAPSGDFYVTGNYFNNITFSSGTWLTGGSSDMFVMKFNSAGTPQWARGTEAITSTLTPAYGSNSGNSIALDAAGNVYVSGALSSQSTTIGSYTFANKGAGGTSDLFLAQYNTNGFLQSAEVSGTSSNETAIEICIKSGQKIMIGSFRGNSLSIGNKIVINGGLMDSFIAHLGPDVTLNTEDPIQKPETIRVFPNPGQGMINIQANEEIVSINVQDAFGRDLCLPKNNTHVYDGVSMQVDLRNNPPGLYLLRILTPHGLISKSVLSQ